MSQTTCPLSIHMLKYVPNSHTLNNGEILKLKLTIDAIFHEEINYKLTYSLRPTDSQHVIKTIDFMWLIKVIMQNIRSRVNMYLTEKKVC